MSTAQTVVTRSIDPQAYSSFHGTNMPLRFFCHATAKRNSNLRIKIAFYLKIQMQWFSLLIFHVFVSDNQSAFAIYGPCPTYSSSTSVLIFQSTRTNIGNHYDNTTGKFIAQYAGIYVFILNLYKFTGADRVYCYIRKNGNAVSLAFFPPESERISENSGSTVVHLDPGDKVDVGGCANPSDISCYTSFIGFLLQAD